MGLWLTCQGNAKPYSDLDLAVMTTDPLPWIAWLP